MIKDKELTKRLCDFYKTRIDYKCDICTKEFTRRRLDQEMKLGFTDISDPIFQIYTLCPKCYTRLICDVLIPEINKMNRYAKEDLSG